MAGLTGTKESLKAAQTDENDQTENITIEDFMNSSDFTDVQNILDELL